MIKQEEVTAEVKPLIESLKNANDVGEHYRIIAEILQKVSTWSCPVDKAKFASLHLSNLLQHLSSFSNQHVQGFPATGLSNELNQAYEAVKNYADLCYPIGT